MPDTKKILVIDDEKDLVEMIKDFLLVRGYEVMTAANGEEGLEQIAKAAPDLIVLDMNMPKMGGIAFYQRIYDAIDDRPKYPVLVLTARANLEQLFRDLNVDGFMTKPFEIDNLMTEVEMILAKKNLAASRSTTPVRKQKKILIVEDEMEPFNALTLAFANAGYAVKAINAGAATFEAVNHDLPDVILIKMGLQDIPGDILAYKLRRIWKTKEVPIILYTSAKGLDEESKTVLKKICEKASVNLLVESNDAYALLKATENLLK